MLFLRFIDTILIFLFLLGNLECYQCALVFVSKILYHFEIRNNRYDMDKRVWIFCNEIYNSRGRCID